MGQFLIAAVAVLVVPMNHAPAVTLAGRNIHVADIVDLGELPPRDRAAISRRIVAQIPSGRRSITISHVALASLVRRSVPALRPVVVDGQTRFEVGAPPLPPAARGCFVLARAVGAGETLAPSDVTESECSETGHAGLRFDRRSHAMRATAALSAGTPVERIAPPPPPAVEAGQKLTLVAQVGPARIERDVVALQPGRNGMRMFVIDGEGSVSSVGLAAEPQGSTR